MIRSATICVAAFVAAATIARPVQALTMQECSTKYKAAQAAGALKGMKWNDFRKAECGPDASAAAPAAAPASTNTVPAAPPTSGKTAAQPRTAPAAAGNAVFVRKKFGLNLVSENTEHGRVYRIATKSATGVKSRRNAA